ncbi:MAG: lycopene cyclase domain-containing protein [Ardenticatenaceae bacterium]|nr:lycopene cyclase domain-containing protein [Ardenticatenaceae bacterium]
MTYFTFLLLFIGIPLTILLWLTWRDWRAGVRQPQRLAGYNPWWVLLAHVVVAVVYTTPWDNYLVATRVWWYDHNLVTGIVLGWVPIEEYTFFVVQTVLTGSWLLFWARRWRWWQTGAGWENGRLRLIAVLLLMAVWLANALILALGWQPGTYLALQLTWALIPIMIQLALGHFCGVIAHWSPSPSCPPFPIWPPPMPLPSTPEPGPSDPAQSLGWLLGGVLPMKIPLLCHHQCAGCVWHGAGAGAGKS